MLFHRPYRPKEKALKGERVAVRMALRGEGAVGSMIGVLLKALPAQITAITAAIQPGSVSRNRGFLIGFLASLIGLITVYTILFRIIMEWEGQDYSWVSGLYWTLTTMSTLGFGDITFKSDVGRLFSVIVLVSGMLLLLVLLPFMFIEFFYSPFVKAQQAARAPRAVSPHLRDHVILTHYDAVTSLLIRRLEKSRTPYVLIVRDVNEALALHDLGVQVVVANLDEPESFQRCGFDRCSLVAATGTDFANTSLTFSAREISPTSTILATANSEDSVDVLTLAGATHVIQLGEQLGGALARRTFAADAQAHVIGSFDDLRIAEAIVAGTPLQGKTLAESGLREAVGVNVVGIWRRGQFTSPIPSTVLTPDTLMVLSGTDEQIDAYNALFCIYHRSAAPCVIVGGGRVGRAAAGVFDQMGLDYRILDMNSERIRDSEKYILGSAADYATLQRAGIEEAPAVLITTRDDDANIYLTIYCRKLRPDIEIIARSNFESNVARLHSAGADVVMSYAAMGSNIIFNLLRNAETLLLAEGLNVFRAKLPGDLTGVTIGEANIRAHTGCSIIAVESGDHLLLNPGPDYLMKEGENLVLIATRDSEEKFLEMYSD